MTITRCQWEDIESRVEHLDGTLHRCLADVYAIFKAEGLAPPGFYLCTAQYGELIIEEGKLTAPSDALTPSDFLNTEPGIPLSLLLNGSAEVFIEQESSQQELPYPVPLRLIDRGDLFGAFEAADRFRHRDRPSDAHWSVSAGARTVHLILNTVDTKWRAQAALSLQHNTWELPDPHKEDAWPSLRAIAGTDNWDFLEMGASAECGTWTVEVLVVPHRWYLESAVSNSDAVTRLKLLISQAAWDQSDFLRTFPVLESQLHQLLHNKRIRLSRAHREFLGPHLRQMAHIMCGQAVGFEVANFSNCKHGPFDYCLRALSEINTKSGKTDYDPVILQPAYIKDGGQVLYSASVCRILGVDTAMEGSDFATEIRKVCSGTPNRIATALGRLGLPSAHIRQVSLEDFQAFAKLAHVLPTLGRDANMLSGFTRSARTSLEEECKAKNVALGFPRLCKQSPFFTSAVLIWRPL
jgi:hypothetical protein